jgi:hypothetical protein
MKQRIILFFALILLFSSCDVRHTHTFRSYILNYYDYKEFVLEISDSGNIIIVGSGGKEIANWESKGKTKATYDSLCVLHNDMSYNTKRDYIGVTHWGDSFKGDILSINVVSNVDFDERHPAHSTLNDVIRLLSVSIYPYIVSGYKNTYDWEGDERLQYSESLMHRGSNEDFYFHPINKTLSEVTSSDLILANSALLVFEKQPDIASVHELTVTIRLSDGRIFTPTITNVFE